MSGGRTARRLGAFAFAPLALVFTATRIAPSETPVTVEVVVADDPAAVVPDDGPDAPVIPGAPDTSGTPGTPGASGTPGAGSVPDGGTPVGGLDAGPRMLGERTVADE